MLAGVVGFESHRCRWHVIADDLWAPGKLTVQGSRRFPWWLDSFKPKKGAVVNV